MKEGRMKITRGTSALPILAVLGAVSSGCIFQEEPRVVRSEPYRDPRVETHEECRATSGTVANETISENRVDVSLSQATECRDTAPRVQEVKTERHANVLWQVTNGSMFALLGGLGAYALASPCTTRPDPTSSNPNPASVPCTDKEQGQTTALGVGLMGAGVLFGAAFIYNVIRAHDTTEIVPAPRSEAWVSKGLRPVPNSPVNLVFIDGQRVPQQTDATGHTVFDFSSTSWSLPILGAGSAKLEGANGREMGTLNLSSLPSFVAARKDTEERGRRQEEEQKRQFDAIGRKAATDRFEEAIAVSEKTKEPWTEQAVITHLNSMSTFMSSKPDVTETRNAVLIERWKKLESGPSSRAKQRIDAEQAKRKADALRGSFGQCLQSTVEPPDPELKEQCGRASAACILCCHAKNPSATQAHCSTVCLSKLTAYTCGK
jgi:hypothetical protein